MTKKRYNKFERAILVEGQKPSFLLSIVFTVGAIIAGILKIYYDEHFILHEDLSILILIIFMIILDIIYYKKFKK